MARRRRIRHEIETSEFDWFWLARLVMVIVFLWIVCTTNWGNAINEQIKANGAAVRPQTIPAARMIR